MFEITRNDLDAFDHYQYEGYLHPNAEYDFTFEARWLIIHRFDHEKVVYESFDMETKKTKHVSRESDPFLSDEVHEKLLPQILQVLAYIREFPWNSFDPHEMITTVFKSILPAYGLFFRPEQLRLSLTIYDGFVGKAVSICEAEVGSGKTIAYLVAGYVANLARKAQGLPMSPVTIATSSVELQRSIMEKDIPQLAKIFSETGLSPVSFNANVRKGKEHYFCLNRYYRFIETKMKNGSSTKAPLPEAFNKSFPYHAFDLDKLDLPNGLKARICVSGSCQYCGVRAGCRYIHFVTMAMSRQIPLMFQVTNHNLYIISKVQDHLLQQSDYVVIDEAHKFKEAAQGTFGAELSERAIPNYLSWSQTLCQKHSYQNHYKKLRDSLLHMNTVLFDSLENAAGRAKLLSEESASIHKPGPYIHMMESMLRTINDLEEIRNGFGGHCMELNGIRKSLDLLTKGNMKLWLARNDAGLHSLCGYPTNLDEILKQFVWNSSDPVSHVLLSGTMNANDNFSYFMREHGLQRLSPESTMRECFPSPFDFVGQTRMYIADDLPLPDQSENYFKAVADRIISLIHATNGHTAVLFTSYRALQQVYELAKPELSDQYDLIRMTRGNKTALDRFRRSSNGVLFSSGSIWEGVDFAGDCLSSVIIVRLPFPRRSALMNLKRAKCKSKYHFVRTYAVPEMLIKLRQGAGRLIRTESDTGVLSILDVRAVRSAYAGSVNQALKQFPLVSSVEEIEHFMHSVKPASYFADNHPNNEADLNSCSRKGD